MIRIGRDLDDEDELRDLGAWLESMDGSGVSPPDVDAALGGHGFDFTPEDLVAALAKIGGRLHFLLRQAEEESTRYRKEQE